MRLLGDFLGTLWAFEDLLRRLEVKLSLILLQISGDRLVDGWDVFVRPVSGYFGL